MADPILPTHQYHNKNDYPRKLSYTKERDPRLGPESCWTIRKAFALLIFANLLLYLDRGIIPGASKEFSAFITESLHTSRPDLFLGLLQSAFILGFSITALVVGHIIHFYSPFKLVGVGLSIFVLASLSSGLSQHSGSYYFLLMARILSGVGEASFQCVVPPFMNDIGGDAAGRWLAILYTCIPVGTAIGYPWGSLFAESELGWASAFFIESIIMSPLALACFFLPFTWRPERAPIEEDEPEQDAEKEEKDHVDDDQEVRSLHNSLNGLRGGGGIYHRPNDDVTTNQEVTRARHISAKDELFAIIKEPVYILTVLGYAASTGMMIGVSTFGSTLLLEFGYFKQESTASSVFGAALSVAGIVGTPIGGILLDRAHLKSEEAKLVFLTRQNFLFSALGMAFCCLSCFMTDRSLFLGSLVLGALFLFVCTAGINLAEMLAVPPSNRSFAIAFSTLCIHALGDVPSPIIIGAILDQLVPECAKAFKGSSSSSSNDDFILTPECEAQLPYVRWTMFIACLWLSVTIITFALAWLAAWRRYKAHHQPHQHFLHGHLSTTDNETMDGGHSREPEGQRKKERNSSTSPLKEPLLPSSASPQRR